MKILALCDDPTKFTGFAEVARNILGCWTEAGHEIRIWAIGFAGAGYWQFPAWRLLPATPNPAKPWHLQLDKFLGELSTGGYTHVWLLNDLTPFTATDFPKKLRHVCALKKIRSLLYFPVDAGLEREWCEIIPLVDVAVTYTEYASQEVRRAGCRTPLHMLPHGVDSELFQPSADRMAFRRDHVKRPTLHSETRFSQDEDFLLVNVNKNEWRKDLFRSLQILAGLRAQNVPAKLLFRTASHSAMAGIALEQAGEKLGLKVDEHWTHLPQLLHGSLVDLYNAADLVLTTTLGEGWGLSITEGLACGCPVAMPMHTACAEIGMTMIKLDANAQIVWLPTEEHGVFGPIDNCLRHRVEVNGAVAAIKEFYQRKTYRRREPLSPAAKQWLSWPRIADEMAKLLVGNPT